QSRIVAAPRHLWSLSRHRAAKFIHAMNASSLNCASRQSPRTTVGLLPLLPQREESGLVRACCKSPLCSGARMPTSADCPKNPSDVRADVGIRAPSLPVAQAASLLYRRLPVGGGWNQNASSAPCERPAGWQPAKQQTGQSAPRSKRVNGPNACEKAKGGLSMNPRALPPSCPLPNSDNTLANPLPLRASWGEGEYRCRRAVFGAPRAAAFTLVELLTVIAIIAVLASLLMTAVASAKKKSR